jgi:saccharopine dehydrogenase (NAD+, L-lysine-forming)
VEQLQGRRIQTAALDADNVEQTVNLIRRFGPDIVINVALPFQDLPLMEACLRTKVHYLDTANYEPPDEPRFEYKWQWAYDARFRDAGIMALLGSGFDPGVTNVFCRYALDNLFDRIESIDIFDCNAGQHGKSFATNFNPEINIREITQPGRYWENGEWHETEPFAEATTFDFPEVGPRKAYLLYHEELESLVKNIPRLLRIRFWMTFSEEYLTHLNVLRNVGMTSILPVEFEGQQVVPIKFLKALLPDPASLAPNYTGKTSIGCLIEGTRGTNKKRVFIYNVCDHRATYEEVRAQAVSYTTGVPAVVGAMMILTGKWRGSGVYNMEQLEPGPFLQGIARYGLPWHVKEC